MSAPDLKEIKNFLVEVAKEAGEIILSRSGRVTFDDKKNAVDLVTEVDKAVEVMVSEKLKSKYPSYKFIGEESYEPGVTKLTNEPTFIVDPIDGTTNFIHFFPHSCISLGFAIDKKPAVGVIFNPFLNQLYTGVKGQGSYLNNEKLPLRNAQERSLSLQGGLCAIEWGSDRSGNNYKVKVDTFESLGADKSSGGGFVHGFRSMGSAAMNLGAVAAGVLDCYWEGGYWPWDVCAGWIILEEAGGKLVSANSGNWNPSVEDRAHLSVRGARPEEQKQFVEDFWSHVKGKLDYSI